MNEAVNIGANAHAPAIAQPRPATEARAQRRLATVGAERPLEGLRLWATAAMAFLLVATNGTPAWWSSAPYCAPIALFLILGRSVDAMLSAAFAQHAKLYTIGLLGLGLCVIFGAVAHPEFATAEAAIDRAAIPLLIYFSVVGIRLTPAGARRLIWAVALGAALMFVRGGVAFYAEWGIPDPLTLLWARYNVLRMSGYMNATLGNVGHVGAYIALVAPPLILAVWRGARGNWPLTLLLAGTLVLGLVNLVISGARTGIVALALGIAIVVARLGLKGGIALIGSLFSFGLVAGYQLAAGLSEKDLLLRFLPSEVGPGVDESAVERVLSIKEGWGNFVDHPFLGIGPGMSPTVNTYTVAHESVIFVLSELGIVGGTIFALLNIVVFFKVASMALDKSLSGQLDWRLLWTIGPACWLFYGLIGGFTFNLSFALVWVGIVHMMLALASSSIQPAAPR